MAAQFETTVHQITVGGPDVDCLVSLVAHRYRRDIIQRLQTTDRPLTADQLALEIIAPEREVPIEMVTLQMADHVRTRLYHAHLPKLAARGVLDYESNSGKVTLTERAVGTGSLIRVHSRSLPQKNDAPDQSGIAGGRDRKNIGYPTAIDGV